MMKNLYYFSVISKIGGIETFFYQLAKKYKNYDLTIVYKSADPEQLKRLRKYVRCIKYNGQTFNCERAFFNFNTDIIDSVNAKEYILVVHGDYENMIKQGQLYKAPDNPKINRYVGVSERACKGFTAVTGKPCELCYNPFQLDEKKKVLNLISATRLSREKGKERMIKLAEALDKANIPYIWTIFTNDTNAIDNPNVIYMKPRLDITNFIANADYLVQLSDNEGYCYSVIEALTQKVPVIVTPCPVFEELGLKNKENCYILDFNMKNIPIEDIYNNIPKFEYEAPKDRWNELLIEGESSYQEERNKRYKVRATEQYQRNKITDSELGRIPKQGEEWEVDYDRMLILTGENKHYIKFVELI